MKDFSALQVCRSEWMEESTRTGKSSKCLVDDHCEANAWTGFSRSGRWERFLRRRDGRVRKKHFLVTKWRPNSGVKRALHSSL
jgi:hypothetical protein